MARPAVDMVVVTALARGVTPSRKPTIEERARAVRHLAAYGYSDSQIAERVGRSVRQVQRIRAAFDIPGLPVGTNRFTRPRGG